MTSSTTYVAFLRALNVAGHSKLKMDVLRQAFVAAGGRNVATYIQTGNVIFDVSASSSDRVFQRMRRTLGKLISSEPTIIFREANDLNRVVKSTPFQGFEENPALKLYVAFLSESPRLKPELPLVSETEKLEILAVRKRTAFIVSRKKKSGMYGFPNKFIEKELGVIATSRNLSTLTRVVDMALAR